MGMKAKKITDREWEEIPNNKLWKELEIPEEPKE